LKRKFTPGAGAGLAVTAFGVLWFGSFPGGLYNPAMNAVKIFPGL
jgi:hypothetical protein